MFNSPPLPALPASASASRQPYLRPQELRLVQLALISASLQTQAPVMSRRERREQMSHAEIISRRNARQSAREQGEKQAKAASKARRGRARLERQESLRQREERKQARMQDRPQARVAGTSAQAQAPAGSPAAAVAGEPSLQVRRCASASGQIKRQAWEEASPLPADCNARLRAVAAKHGLQVEVLGERNGTTACLGEAPVLAAADTKDDAVAVLQQAEVRTNPAIVDDGDSTCRTLLSSGATPLCHLRSTIGLTTVDQLIKELDPVLQRFESVYVFMSREESEAWLAQMRQRPDASSHLPVIRLTSNNWLESRLALSLSVPILSALACAAFIYLVPCSKRAEEEAQQSGGDVQVDRQITLVTKDDTVELNCAGQGEPPAASADSSASASSPGDGPALAEADA